MKVQRSFFLYLVCAVISVVLFMDSIRSGVPWRSALLGLQLFFFIILTFQTVRQDENGNA